MIENQQVARAAAALATPAAARPIQLRTTPLSTALGTRITAFLAVSGMIVTLNACAAPLKKDGLLGGSAEGQVSVDEDMELATTSSKELPGSELHDSAPPPVAQNPDNVPPTMNRSIAPPNTGLQ